MEKFVKLEIYVPNSHVEVVKDAVFRAGAGRIGNYDCCCWQTVGTGQFRPLSGSNPFLVSCQAQICHKDCKDSGFGLNSQEPPIAGYRRFPAGSKQARNLCNPCDKFELDRTLGSENKIELVEELKIEIICPAEIIKEIIAAMRIAHPYETPAFQYWPVSTE